MDQQQLDAAVANAEWVRDYVENGEIPDRDAIHQVCEAVIALRAEVDRLDRLAYLTIRLPRFLRRPQKV